MSTFSNVPYLPLIKDTVRPAFLIVRLDFRLLSVVLNILGCWNLETVTLTHRLS